MAYFDPGSVIWDLKSTCKYDAIREIIGRTDTFAECPGLDLNSFAEKVVERERLQSTGMGRGVAVAHGRTSQVNSPTIALGVSREGIDFEAIDGKPVHLLFIVANHPDQAIDYLHILTTLVTMVRSEMFRRELLSCTKASEAQKKLCAVFADLLKRTQLRFAS